MIQIRFIAYAFLVTFVSACSSDLDRRYLNVSVTENLEIPPDLTVPEAGSQFRLPQAFSADDSEKRDQIPVLPKIESLQLQRDSNLYWLEVSEPVDSLYQLVKNFWAAEGYSLQVDEPVIGIMQTEWVYKKSGFAKPPLSWWKELFESTNLAATQDQYRTRIERDPQQQISRVFVVHRGTHLTDSISVKESNNANNEMKSGWDFRRPESELEVEMLSRLMVFLGLEKNQVDQQFESAKLFKPRATIQIDPEEKAPFLLLRDSYQIAWNRVIHQLERMNFDIASADFENGKPGKGFLVVNGASFDQLLEPKPVPPGSVNDSTRQFVLMLSKDTHQQTRVDIETIDGDSDQSTAGSQFLNLLYRRIK